MPTRLFKQFQHNLACTSWQTLCCQPPQAAIGTLHRRLAVLAAERDALVHTGATATGGMQPQSCWTTGSQTDIVADGGAQACSSCAGLRWVPEGHEFRVQSILYTTCVAQDAPGKCIPSATTLDTRTRLVLGISSCSRFQQKMVPCMRLRPKHVNRRAGMISPTR